MNEEDSKRKMKDYSCFKIKSNTASCAQFLHSPCSQEKNTLSITPSCVGVTISGSPQPLFRPAQNCGWGAYYAKYFWSPLEKHTSYIIYFFFKHHLETFSVLFDMHINTSCFVNCLFRGNHQKLVIRNPLVWRHWADERIKTWKWRFHLQISHNSRCKIRHPTTVTRICTKTYT